jgi:hypothetical protein
MAIVTTTPETALNVTAVTTTNIFYWLTGWMPAIAMDSAVGTLKIANAAGAVRIQAAFQVATNRTDKPSAPSLAGATVQSADGEYMVPASDYNLGSVTPGVTYIRYGVAVKVNSVPNTGTADVTLQMSTLSLGMLLPPWSGHLTATDSTKVFVPISGWLSILEVLKVEATIVVADLTGSFAIKLTFRTATASPESPDAWDSTGLGSLLTANGETNSGELAVTTSGKALIQLGFFYQTTSGVGQADITVLLGIRQAT